MIEIPQGVNVRMDGHVAVVKGPQGEVKRELSKKVAVKISGNQIEVLSESTTAEFKALTGTTESLLNNMVHGVVNPYSKNFKLIYAHFPISIEVKGNDITIKNFLGEKQPRKTVLVGATKVQAKGQQVTVSGPDKEAVGQTIANMRTAMRIRDKDGRIFQDGMYDSE